MMSVDWSVGWSAGLHKKTVETQPGIDPINFWIWIKGADPDPGISHSL